MSRPLVKLGVGAARFGATLPGHGGRRRMSDAEAFAAVGLAIDAGVDLFDTSPHHRESEAVLGRVLPSRPPVRVATKTAPLSDGLDAVERRARTSLAMLGRPRASALLVSAAADLLGSEGEALWARLRKLKDEGLFEQIGFCAGPHDDPAGLARRFKPDLVQMPVSLLDQRLVASGALSEVAELGCEVQLRSVFLRGLLFLPRDGLPGSLAEAGPKLSRIRRAIAEAGADPMQAALAFALGRPEASAVIVGVQSAAELRAVLGAARAALPAPRLDWGALALDHPLALDPNLWAAA